MTAAAVTMTGLADVQAALTRLAGGGNDAADHTIVGAAKTGLGKAALHLAARGEALAPIAPTMIVDTDGKAWTRGAVGQMKEFKEKSHEDRGGTLQNSVAFNPPVRHEGSKLVATVSARAENEGVNYAEKVHENMEYDGPNVGGSRTQNRGPRTLAKVNNVEPSDGSPGGKYLERPLRNKTEQYVEIIRDEVAKVV